mmetsp:Transcript_7872/g.27102  ORF Transcript_7872/g.27102 Transcript_7872/m.27102 type:complete len:238 (+) Transcript_7872:442-1155(+)
MDGSENVLAATRFLSGQGGHSGVHARESRAAALVPARHPRGFRTSVLQPSHEPLKVFLPKGVASAALSVLSRQPPLVLAVHVVLRPSLERDPQARPLYVTTRPRALERRLVVLLISRHHPNRRDRDVPRDRQPRRHHPLRVGGLLAVRYPATRRAEVLPLVVKLSQISHQGQTPCHVDLPDAEDPAVLHHNASDLAAAARPSFPRELLLVRSRDRHHLGARGLKKAPKKCRVPSDGL